MTQARDSSVVSITTFLWASLAVASISTVVAIGFFAHHFSGRGLASSPAAWGAFGDYVGGVLNPVFAFLALIALLVTLRFQVVELRNSTDQLEKSAGALVEQNNTATLQNFERAFFEMLRLHNDIVAGIDLKTIGKKSQLARTTNARDCFRVFYSRFAREARPALRGDFNSLSYHDAMRLCYDRFHEKNQHNIGHYFRNLYRIFKFVDESNVKNKTRYTGLLRAQLSTYELALLFYNGIGTVGGKFPKLMVEFQLLENFDVTHLLEWEEDQKIYSANIFGEQRSSLGL